MRSLNGLFDLQCYSSESNDQKEEILQLWYAHSVDDCNLVEMPQSGRVFNFVESLLPLNVRKEIENCLPASFEFWAIPIIKKLLAKKIGVNF